MKPETRKQRIEDVTDRAAQPDHMYRYCRIIGCNQPTTAGAAKGLNRLYCRRHEDHYERHGSYTKRSYTAAELKPHRAAARKWIADHRHEQAVILAIKAIEGLYASVGPKVEAFRLRGMSPADRAGVTWARLRDSGVDPTEPLAAWISIESITQADPLRENREEFKVVQAAKLVHRMASGTHKSWERTRPGGQVVTEELHVYPHSRGRVLRHVGCQLQSAAELVSRFLIGRSSV